MNAKLKNAEADVIQMLKANRRKIDIIMHYRDMTGMSLKESRDAVERLDEQVWSEANGPQAKEAQA